MKYLNYIVDILLIPFYVFSLLVPRKSDIWVMGSWFGKRYSDNSRYIYEHLQQHHKDIRAIWITRDKDIKHALQKENYEVYYANSLKGFWYTCRATVGIFTENITDINPLAASKLLKVQLWHGIPLKKIVYDDNLHHRIEKSNRLIKRLKNIKTFLFPFRNVYQWDIVIATSLEVSSIFQSAFRVDSSRVLITGQPRADIILSSQPKIPNLVTNTKNRFPSSRFIAYLPTFRADNRRMLDILSIDQLGKVQYFLESNNMVLFIKMHYVNLNIVSHLDKTKYSRIIFIDEGELADVNYLLPLIDLLITDYSSVFFDYLLLDRPIIFTPFDIKEYLTLDRQMYGDYSELTPGPKCSNWDEVVFELEKYVQGFDNYEKQRSLLLRRFHQYIDINNCERIINGIKKQLIK